MKDTQEHTEREPRPREDDPEQTRPFTYFGIGLGGIIFLLVVVSVSL